MKSQQVYDEVLYYSPDGLTEGDVEGMRLGAVVGEPVGEDVGPCVGLLDGCKDTEGLLLYIVSEETR